jgi:hypothetical protein
MVVLVDDLSGDTFHAEDLDVEAAAAGDGVFNLVELLLVDLGHVDVETWGLSAREKRMAGREGGKG